MNLKTLVLAISAIMTWISATAAVVEVGIVSKGEDIDLTSLPVAALGAEGLFCAAGNEIVAIDMTDEAMLRRITLPDSLGVDDFCVCGDRIVVHDGESVVWFGMDGRFDGIGFADGDFRITAATDSTFFLLRPGAVDEVSIRDHTPLKSIATAGTPVGAAVYGSGYVIATESEIWLSIPEGKNLLHRHPLPIRSLAVGNAGIFFCTASDLWRLEGIDTLEHIATGEFFSIAASGSYLYLIDARGNLYRFEYP